MTALLTRPRLEPDAARMMRARRGDVVAFAELVERYWGPVVGRFVRQLGDRQEAEDLAQDVFLRLYRRPPSLSAAGASSRPGYSTSRRT